MDSKTLQAAAEYLAQQAAQLRVLEAANDGPAPSHVISLGPVLTAGDSMPWMPAFRGAEAVGHPEWLGHDGRPLGVAEPGWGWQVILRRLHRQNGGAFTDCNVPVREHGLTPAFPDPIQPWEADLT